MALLTRTAKGVTFDVLVSAFTASGGSKLMGNFGMKELVIILLVVLLVFGAKKLKTIGSDLG